MKKIESIKTRISYALLCSLFGFSIGVILLSEIINFKNTEIISKNIVNLERKDKTISNSQIAEDCVITNKQANKNGSEDDILFLGCGGFF